MSSPNATLDNADQLDPGMRAVLAEVATWPSPETADPVASGRAAAERFIEWSRPSVPVASVEDVEIRRSNRPLRLRVYRPTPEPAALMLYLHGGGWSAGSVELADRLCRRLAKGSGRAVVSVDYALAPEHPYPAALGDCVDALEWISKEAVESRSDGRPPVVVGESAGANLAAALCLQVRSDEGPRIAQQTLICPVLDLDVRTKSHQRWGSGKYLISSSALAESWCTYLGGRSVDELAAPLHAKNLTGLPEATIVIAQCDPLRDDGASFARKLTAAGVSAELIEAAGLLHGFIYMDAVSEAAARMVDRICALHSTYEESED